MSERALPSDEIDAAIAAFASGWLTMGPRIQAFEQALADLFSVGHAVAVSSATAAMHLAALAAGGRDARDTIVSAIATCEAVNGVRLAGATPIRWDIEAVDRPYIDWVSALRTRPAVLVVSHHFGHPHDMAGIRTACEAAGTVLVEDATTALGARLDDGRWAGTTGHVGCVGVGPGTLVAAGEGAAVVTDDAEIAACARLLRSHAMTSVTWDRHRGHADSYDIVNLGFNYRLDEPRAALAQASLGHLGYIAERRRKLVLELVEAVPPSSGLKALWRHADGAAPVALGLIADSAQLRTACSARLQAEGVEVRTWPDGFPAMPASDAPTAAASRDRTLLIPLDAAEPMDQANRIQAALT